MPDSGKLISGLRRNSYIFVPGFGYVANHPQALQSQHLKVLAGLGYKIMNDRSEINDESAPPLGAGMSFTEKREHVEGEPGLDQGMPPVE